MSFEALCEEGRNVTMYYVYILQSIKFPDQYYTGWTEDVLQRLESHNSGANMHTNKFRPWQTVWFCSFVTKEKAIAFEKYLKSASGIAFRRKRLV